MSEYAINLTNELIRVLRRANELPPHRLAGYAANIDFWMDEVKHRMVLIDGYVARFKKMREATKNYTYHDPLMGYDKYGEPIHIPDKRTTKSWKSREQQELRDILLKWGRKFLKRCFQEGFIEQQKAVELCHHIDIDPDFLNEK
jgi:hypothetical protein